MFGLFFTDAKQIRSFDEVMACDKDKFSAFFHGMLDAGVYLAPSAFEAGFVSSAHSSEDLDATISVARDVFARL